MWWGQALAMGATVFCAGMALNVSLVTAKHDLGWQWPAIAWSPVAGTLFFALIDWGR